MAEYATALQIILRKMSVLMYACYVPSDEANATILDCTFRDGGYYTDWHFSSGLVSQYLNAMRSSKIEHVEIGFRSSNPSGTRGPFAYSSTAFLASLDLPDTCTYGVMINASEFIDARGLDSRGLKKVFPKSDPHVTFVRIAAHLQELSLLQELVSFLANRGYQVMLNIMQASKLRDPLLEAPWGDISKLMSLPIDVLTLADSFGDLTPLATSQLVNRLTELIDKPVGLHMHDNKGLALANSLSGVASGASFVDAAVAGMGRGPGNTRTEFALDLLSQPGNFDNAVTHLALEFEELRDRYGWGPSILYFIAANTGVHPSYVQYLAEHNLLAASESIHTLTRLSQQSAQSFSVDQLMASTVSTPSGATSDSVTLGAGWCKGKPVVVLGGGSGLGVSKKYLEQLLRRRHEDTLIIGMSTGLAADEKLVDYVLIADHYKLQSSPLPTDVPVITSGAKLDDSSTSSHSALIFSPGHLSPEWLHEWQTNPTALLFALEALAYGQASTVYLAYFDGFPQNPTRHARVQQTLSFAKRAANYDLRSVTPTTYDIERESIFSLE